MSYRPSSSLFNPYWEYTDWFQLEHLSVRHAIAVTAMCHICPIYRPDCANLGIMTIIDRTGQMQSGMQDNHSKFRLHATSAMSSWRSPTSVKAWSLFSSVLVSSLNPDPWVWEWDLGNVNLVCVWSVGDLIHREWIPSSYPNIGWGCTKVLQQMQLVITLLELSICDDCVKFAAHFPQKY